MSPLSKKIVIILSLVVIAFVATGYVRARSNDEKPIQHNPGRLCRRCKEASLWIDERADVTLARALCKKRICERGFPAGALSEDLRKTARRDADRPKGPIEVGYTHGRA